MHIGAYVKILVKKNLLKNIHQTIFFSNTHCRMCLKVAMLLFKEQDKNCNKINFLKHTNCFLSFTNDIH